MNDILKSNALPVGRASTAIYLILKKCNLQGKVLVPANICYAAVYPAIYNGLEPQFLDVDKYSGNITFETLLKADLTGVSVAIIPHMYGNPVDNLPKMVDYLHKNNITVIEDCASAMGAEADYNLGHVGDFTVYSTGYSKTLDLGFGGFLCSDGDQKEFSELETALPEYNESCEEGLKLFSRIYRLLRNENYGTSLKKSIYSAIPGALKDGFIYKIDKEKKNYLLDGLKGLKAVIAKRREMQKYYESKLSTLSAFIYKYKDGAVPWRMNMLLEPEVKRKVIDELLKNNLPVSDWYPVVLPLFDCQAETENALWHELHIINFPLLIEKDKIDSICDIILKQVK